MTILTLKNKELQNSIIAARDLSSITSKLILGQEIIPDEDIREINLAKTYLYSSNELVCDLDENGADVFADSQIRVNGFWKVSDSSGQEFLKYHRFETRASVSLFSPTRIVIRISEEDANDVATEFSARGIPKPDFGMLVVVLKFKNKNSQKKSEIAFLIKYTHNPLFSSVLLGGRLVDLRLPVNTYKTPPYSSETFFVPEISANFVYNFFENEEADYDVYRTRDYEGQPLQDIPKYIRVSWTKPLFDPPAFEDANTQLLAAMSSSSSVFIIPPPPRRTEEAEPETSLIRIGGIIISSANLSDAMARAMNDSPRTARDASNIFDRDDIVQNPLGDSFATFDPETLDEELVTIARRSDYVGYVLEKSRLTEEGDFEIVDLIAIKGKDTLEYIDWKIAYGEVYRYRLRSVFRFINKHNLSMFKDTDAVITKSQSISYVDENTAIQLGRTFYFDSAYSDVSEIQTTEETRPDPPDGVRIFPNSSKRHILIVWTQKSQNRDIVGFNVYRRTKDTKFIKLNQEMLGIRTNYYKDIDIEIDTDYIYAIESVDFHGNYSQLSVQFSARVQEPKLDVILCERLPKFIAREGLELFAEPEPKAQNLITFKNKFRLNVNPLFQNTDENNTFVLRVTSLDTGIKKEIKINFRTMTIYHTAPYVPSPSRRYASLLSSIAESLRRI